MQWWHDGPDDEFGKCERSLMQMPPPLHRFAGRLGPEYDEVREIVRVNHA